MYDDGDPSLNSTTQVVVSVEDVNDNSPEFLERYYKIDILEAVVDEDEAFLQNDQQNADDLLSNLSDPEAAKAAAKAAKEAERTSVDRQWEELFENSTWDSFGAKFDFAKNAGRVKEVFRTIARDPDSGPNGEVAYKMKAGGAAEGKFQIHPKTGIVYAVGNILAGESYEMLIRWVISFDRL